MARSLAYGLGSVVIGVFLARRGLSGVAAGAIFAAMLAGSAVVTIAVGRFGDQVGRRRAYRALCLSLAAAGTVFAVAGSLPILVLAALAGTISTDVLESGPFNALDQAMLPQTGGPPARLFATYNTAATLAGSLGALLAFVASSQLWLLAYPAAAAVALLATRRLSGSVEQPSPAGHLPSHRRKGSRRTVFRLAWLFALDSFGGGFVPQSFMAYLFVRRYGASAHDLAILFFAIGLLQAVSFQGAVRLARRIGLLRTMVFTHLPSNLLLAAVAFAPSLPLAVGLLLARYLLSQADVPTRQAYIVQIVDAAERTSAVAYTNSARYLSRPIAPVLSGAATQLGLGAPFLIAGALKIAYDLGLFTLFRNVPVPDHGERR